MARQLAASRNGRHRSDALGAFEVHTEKRKAHNYDVQVSLFQVVEDSNLLCKAKQLVSDVHRVLGRRKARPSVCFLLNEKKTSAGICVQRGC